MVNPPGLEGAYTSSVQSHLGGLKVIIKLSVAWKLSHRQANKHGDCLLVLVAQTVPRSLTAGRGAFRMRNVYYITLVSINYYQDIAPGNIIGGNLVLGLSKHKHSVLAESISHGSCSKWRGSWPRRPPMQGIRQIYYFQSQG